MGCKHTLNNSFWQVGFWAKFVRKTCHEDLWFPPTHQLGKVINILTSKNSLEQFLEAVFLGLFFHHTKIYFSNRFSTNLQKSSWDKSLWILYSSKKSAKEITAFIWSNVLHVRLAKKTYGIDVKKRNITICYFHQ